MLKGRAAAISIAVAIVLAAVLLYYSLRGIEWKEVGRIIASANRRVLLFAAFLATGSLFLRSLRWRVLLNAEGRIGVPAVFVVTFAHAMLLGAGRVATMHFLAGRDEEWWLGVRECFFLYFDWEMMTYWAIIAVSHAFDYYRESQDRALTTAQLQTRLAEARLQALQRQLHPHFLFNTLHTISALMHRDIDAADSMLARLSDLLRLTLDRVGTQLHSDRSVGRNADAGIDDDRRIRQLLAHDV